MFQQGLMHKYSSAICLNFHCYERTLICVDFIHLTYFYIANTCGSKGKSPAAARFFWLFRNICHIIYNTVKMFCCRSQGQITEAADQVHTCAYECRVCCMRRVWYARARMSVVDAGCGRECPVCRDMSACLKFRYMDKRGLAICTLKFSFSYIFLPVSRAGLRY